MYIREATLLDVAQLEYIEKTCFQNSDGLISRRQFRYHIKHARNALWVISDAENQIPFGYVLLFVRANNARIYSLAILPAKRGMGASKMLMHYALDALRKQGVSRVYLEVRANNYSALKLYERLGFSIESHLKSYYGEIDGLRLFRNLS